MSSSVFSSRYVIIFIPVLQKKEPKTGSRNVEL